MLSKGFPPSLKELLGSIKFVQVILNKYRYLRFRFNLKRFSKEKHNLSIIIGASGDSSKGWISTEFSWHDITSQQSWSNFFEPGKVKRILAEHVLEHLSMEEAVRATQNFYKYLEPGGYVRIAVPDGNHSSPEYIENVRPGGIGPGALDHKLLYTFSTLKTLFSSQGFIVEGLEYFSDSGVFISNDWKTEDGMIHRSYLNDERNKGGVNNYTSIIIDAFKPG